MQAVLLENGFDSMQIDDPMDAVDITEHQDLYKYDYINEEITRKRDEFGLETLDKEKKQTTLAVKRMQEAEAELIKAQSDPRYLPAYQKDVDAALGEIKNYTTEDYAELKAIAEKLTKLNPELFGAAAEKLQVAADRLREYEEYK